MSAVLFCTARLPTLLKRLPPLFNLIQRVKSAPITAGTRLCNASPSIEGIKILRPERPCPTLNRTLRIDSATPGLVAQQNAIPVRILLQRLFFRTYRPNENMLEHRRCESHLGGDAVNVILRDPNVSLSAGTATSAYCTPKLQTILVPR